MHFDQHIFNDAMINILIELCSLYLLASYMVFGLHVFQICKWQKLKS